MDILSLIDKFIQWCDGNVGFLNVILSLCTLILTVTIAKLPYKKKIVGSLEIIPEKTQYEPFFKCFIRVYLTNVGRVPIYPMRRKTHCFSYGDIRRVHRIYASN